jgi:hypothetical protein
VTGPSRGRRAHGELALEPEPYARHCLRDCTTTRVRADARRFGPVSNRVRAYTREMFERTYR